MIEHCADLLECEQVLSKEVEGVSLLGELPFTSEDLEHLTDLIRQKITPNVAIGTRFLKQKAPTCLACYLVQTGIVGYGEGNYWSAVHESIGLVDPNWQMRWGRIFIDYLRTNGLPEFSVEGGHKYVTPILAHGGIPDDCLTEFFGAILLPMVQRSLMNPASREEIVHELATLRSDNDVRATLEQEFGELEERRQSLESRIVRLRQIVKAYDEVVQLWRLKDSIRESEGPAGKSEKVEAELAEYQRRLQTLERELKIQEKQRAEGEELLARFWKRDGHILAQVAEIRRTVLASGDAARKDEVVTNIKAEEARLADQLQSDWRLISVEPWEDRFGFFLSRAPLQDLASGLERINQLSSRLADARQELDKLQDAISTHRQHQFIVTAITGAAGLISVTVGALTTIWLLVVGGLGLLFTAGAVVRYWRQESSRKQQQERKLRRRVDTVQSERRDTLANISGYLSDLPIDGRLLEASTQDLHSSLLTIADSFRELDRVRTRRFKLQQEIDAHLEQTVRTATVLGIQTSDDLPDMVGRMKRVLQRAYERHESARRVEELLESEIRPRIAALREEHRLATEEIALLEGYLAQQVQERQELQDEIENADELLRKQYPDLEFVQQEIRASQQQGKGKAFFEQQIMQLDQQLSGVQKQIDDLNQQLSYHHLAFAGVDEPVRRYLLYGGEAATGFLVKSVFMLHGAITEDKVPGPAEANLPPRVISAFEHWWVEHQRRAVQQTDEIDAATGARFRAPAFLLEPAIGEITIRVPSQRYLAHAGRANAYFEVATAFPDSQSHIFRLRVYRHSERLLETQEVELPLPFPATHYELRLKSGGSVIHKWELAGLPGEKPFMAFDWRSGKLIKDESLPNGHIRLVSEAEAAFSPPNCLLTEGTPLYGRWKGFVYHELNLENVERLLIKIGQGPTLAIPVSSQKLRSPELLGGQLLQGAHCEEAEIYVGIPPKLRIPLEDEAELQQLRLSIYPGEASFPKEWLTFRLAELEEALELHSVNGWVDVSLANPALLGQRPFGYFRVRLRKHPYADWDVSFCLIPTLEVTFNRDVYLPYRGNDAPVIRAIIRTAENFVFHPLPPAEQKEYQEGFCRIGTSGTNDAIRGMLAYAPDDGEQYQAPLTITIPKVYWRLQGLVDQPYTTWCAAIAEEVWLADWERVSELFLVVKTPRFIEGMLTLGLEEEPVREERRAIRDKRTRFDLLAFRDALNTGPPVRTLTLTLSDSPTTIEQARLLSVRNRWEAQDIECVQEARGRTIILGTKWTERGKAKRKIIRLWSVSSTRPRPIIEEAVAERARTFSMKVSVTDLPPGKYLIQLGSEDPWSPGVPVRPSAGAPNTREIQIVALGDLLQGDRFNILSVSHASTKKYPLERGAYKIEIVGKIVHHKLPIGVGPDVRVFKNEGWYVGSFETTNDPGVNAELAAANPVKFEFIRTPGIHLPDIITAIEDREGDGAMYCRICQRLYWGQDTLQNEEQRGHGHWLVGPDLQFDIKWEPLGE
jgi:hypothetical protein